MYAVSKRHEGSIPRCYHTLWGRVRNALLARGQGCPIAPTFPDLSIKTNTRRLLLRTPHPRSFTFARVDLSVRILNQVSGPYLLAGHDSPHRRDWVLYSLARVLAVVVEPGWWWEQQAALLPCRRASALHACPCRPPGSPLSPALHSPEVQSSRRRLVAVKPTLCPLNASSALRCFCRPLRAASALPHYKLRPSLSDANLPHIYYNSPHLFIPTSLREQQPILRCSRPGSNHHGRYGPWKGPCAPAVS